MKLIFKFEFEDGLVIIDGPPDYYKQHPAEKNYVIVDYKGLSFQGKLIKVSIQ